MNATWSDNDRAALIDDFQTQAEELCPIQDHVTRVVANLNIPTERFADYDHPEKTTYDLDPVIRMFLYQHVRDLTQSELADRLRGAAYVYIRLGLSRPPG